MYSVTPTLQEQTVATVHRHAAVAHLLRIAPVVGRRADTTGQVAQVCHAALALPVRELLQQEVVAAVVVVVVVAAVDAVAVADETVGLYQLQV